MIIHVCIIPEFGSELDLTKPTRKPSRTRFSAMILESGNASLTLGRMRSVKIWWSEKLWVFIRLDFT